MGGATANGLDWLDWTIVVAYILAMIGMSVWLSRKQSSVEDYYLGGNNLPWWAIGISTMATQCSSNSFLGTPAFIALGAGGGLLYLQSELALPLAMVVVILLLLPFFRRAEVISVYEYLELRFGVGTRTALSGLFQVSRALATGVTVYSVALVLEMALQIPLWLSIVIVGVVTVIYDTFGGMEAVVYSDVIQMLVLYGSAVYLVVWSIVKVGGLTALLTFWSQPSVTVPAAMPGAVSASASASASAVASLPVPAAVQAAHAVGATTFGAATGAASGANALGAGACAANFCGDAIATVFETPTGSLMVHGGAAVPAPSGDVTIGLAERFRVLQLEQFGFEAGEDWSFWACLLGFLFLYMSYYGCDQSQVQRELSSKDIDDTNLSLFVNGVLRFFLAGTMVLMGLAIGAVLFTDMARNHAFLTGVLAEPARQNQMVIYAVLTYMPHGMIGLVVVAIFAAAMSSLDSAINSLSATTMRDVYERFVNPQPEHESERPAWEATQLRWSRYLTVFWGAFCTGAAFLTPYLGDNVVVAINKLGSLTYGPILGVFLLAIMTKRATDMGALAGLAFGVAFDLYLWVGTDVSWLWWNVFGCAVTMAVGYGVSLLDRVPRAEQVEGYVWTAGAYESFGYKRNWRAYCVALVGFFFLFLFICTAIQSIPAFFAAAGR